MVVQLNVSPEIEVLHKLFERSLSNFSMTSLKQNVEYFHFRCKILLGRPVGGCAKAMVSGLVKGAITYSAMQIYL